MSRQTLRTLASASLLLGVATAASAQDVAPVSIAGTEVAKRTKKVMSGYRWSETLDEVFARARKSEKLVFWIDIVGDLDDGL